MEPVLVLQPQRPMCLPRSVFLPLPICLLILSPFAAAEEPVRSPVVAPRPVALEPFLGRYRLVAVTERVEIHRPRTTRRRFHSGPTSITVKRTATASRELLIDSDSVAVIDPDSEEVLTRWRIKGNPRPGVGPKGTALLILQTLPQDTRVSYAGFVVRSPDKSDQVLLSVFRETLVPLAPRPSSQTVRPRSSSIFRFGYRFERIDP